jgi:hypothetical protein
MDKKGIMQRIKGIGKMQQIRILRGIQIIMMKLISRATILMMIFSDLFYSF